MATNLSNWGEGSLAEGYWRGRRRDRLSVMWNRTYGKEKFANLYDKYHACSQLNMMLELTGCKRLVIGHTPQVRAPNCDTTMRMGHGPRSAFAML